MIGGPRYEMVELPDSMMSTTLWVGNLCQFVTDEALSEAFRRAGDSQCVPACVARKPNAESMRYGFVTFCSEEDKETAIDLMDGYELQGERLRVEPVRDHEKHGRIRAPQKFVEYAVGPVKRRRNGEVNHMRRATGGGGRTGAGDGDGEDGYGHDGDRRRARSEKRKTRGRYKNQRRKNSRATRFSP